MDTHTFVQTSNMSDQQQQQNQINIEISEEVAEGQYANLAIITHSHAEFVIDFVNVMPGTPKSKVKSRIIFTFSSLPKMYPSFPIGVCLYLYCI